ncbi:carbohydrate sulfotransferase 5-like isoform X2 [Centruroides sculpturatus]|uniref:carbohydrate sulfotransferase 5-like isoform X2 n=1 Tax=Centruroides sculpturatus TaxID=218467 RepID=UPI000C6D6AE9|nr:carbohydrate sulfotransferase 5-like isoform X2 [Centruroides sculpturatus]
MIKFKTFTLKLFTIIFLIVMYTNFEYYFISNTFISKEDKLRILHIEEQLEENISLSSSKTSSNSLIVSSTKSLHISKLQQNSSVFVKDNVTRILLITFLRGGSSFLGDLIQQNPKTFYFFEPLHFWGLRRKFDSYETSEVFNTLSHLFRCQFNETIEYNRYMSKRPFMFHANKYLMSNCKNSVLCRDIKYHYKICSQSQSILMKVARLNLKDALVFLKQNSDLDIKLVYLSRDPRAILNSRKPVVWCRNVTCNTPFFLCNEMRSDLGALNTFNMFFHWIRYEDLSLDPENMARNLYKWLSIPFTSEAARFVQTHTNSQSKRKIFSSTYRNSLIAPFQWIHHLSFKEIDRIQKECGDVMYKLGYKMIDNSTYYIYNSQEFVNYDKNTFY